MLVVEWLKDVYKGQEWLLVATGVLAACLVVAAIAAFVFGNASIYTAFAFIFVGGAGVVAAFVGVEERAGLVSCSALCIVGGSFYLLLFSLLSLRRMVRERKRRRMEIRRRMQYTLPDRENSYVRMRLNTALQVPKMGMNEDMDMAKANKGVIKLGYARQLLNKVREAPLSPAERLQAEEMEKAFALYFHKDGWTREELQTVNELCASILKLSAKYAV